MREYLATIQVIQRDSTGVENALAGNVRVWLWIPDKANGSCRGFSLIFYAFWLQAMSRSICITDELRKLTLPALRSRQILCAGRQPSCYKL